MSDLLLEGSKIAYRHTAAPLDAATLNAALYCIDAIAPNEQLIAKADHLILQLESWLCLTPPQSPPNPPLGAKFDFSPGRWEREALCAHGVVIIAPSPFSLVSLSVLELCIRLKIPVQAIVLRRFTLNRFVQESHRDGIGRLLKKIWRKLVLRADENAAKTNVSLKSISRALKPQSTSVRSLARRNHIPVIAVAEFDQSISRLRALSPQLAIFTGGGLIKKPVIDVFERGILNIHMGALPQYKGMDVVQAPILDGSFEFVGLTGHFMTAELDAGPVLSWFNVDAQFYSSLTALRNELSAVTPLIAIDTALGIFSGRLPLNAQPGVGRQYYFIHQRLDAVIETVLSKRAAARANQPPANQITRVTSAFLAGLV
ncbi:MAG: formyltransferase family protein [Hyphomicrobiaceae bacterium]